VADIDSLKRLTTEYQPLEDRVRLSGQGAAGAVTVVWVTQRLLNRLTPELVRWLEAQEKPMPRADLVQSFKQQTARAAVPQQPAVPAEQASASWLATAVDVQRRAGSLRLVFRDAEAQEQVALELSPLALRQWLNMLLIAYGRGEWPLAVWPQWMQEQLAAPAASPRAVH